MKELIVIIANNGNADEIMEVAKSKGAAGGTILHGRGSASKDAEHFFGINLPEKMVLEVTESSPAVAGNTATNALKEVTVETGLVVKVPMFINQGDKIIVTTWDGKYSSRA